MALQSVLAAIAIATWLQGSSLPALAPAGNCLTPLEEKQLSSETKIEARIKTYRLISERIHQAVEGAVARQSFNEVPSLLRCWKDHLTKSLKDIEAKVNRKKKSGALIDYEIQLRKSMVDITDARLKAPYTEQEEFESWMAQATLVHEKFVDILFQR